MLGSVGLPWEKKFGHGSSPGSGNFTSSLPSTSKFRHIFCHEYMGDMLGAMVLPREDKYRHGSLPGSAI